MAMTWYGVTRPKLGAIQSDIDDLRAIAAGVKDRFAREYIEEAVRCLEVDARRAFVVFLWTGAVSAIREEVWRFGSKAIQSALQAGRVDRVAEPGRRVRGRRLNLAGAETDTRWPRVGIARRRPSRATSA
jgi:hypothetical protein